MSRRTYFFLAALALTTFAIVSHDVCWQEPEPPRAAESAEPAQPPSVARNPSRAVLAYPGEFVSALGSRLRNSLLTAQAADDGVVESGVVVGPHSALVPSGNSARSWTVRIGEAPAIAAQSAGVDPVHGVTLLRLPPEQPPATPRAIQESSETTPEPVIVIRPRSTLPAIQYLEAANVPLVSRLARVDLSAGDAIVDLDGGLVGFVGRTAQGVNVLDARLLRQIVHALETGGRHPHPWIGAELQTITPALRERFTEGALAVVTIETGSPAARAGLRPGHALEAVTIGDRRAVTAEEVANALDVGDPVVFHRVPQGASIAVMVEDLQLPLTERRSARGLRADARAGVAVTVAPGSTAAGAGLQTGDIIEAVDLRVATPQTVDLLRQGNRAALLTVRRGDRRWFVWLPGTGAGSSRSSRAGAKP